MKSRYWEFAKIRWKKMERWELGQIFSEIFVVKSLRTTFQSSNMAMTHILFVDDFFIKASI